jgi:hypothetical protein
VKTGSSLVVALAFGRDPARRHTIDDSVELRRLESDAAAHRHDCRLGRAVRGLPGVAHQPAGYRSQIDDTSIAPPDHPWQHSTGQITASAQIPREGRIPVFVFELMQGAFRLLDSGLRHAGVIHQDVGADAKLSSDARQGSFRSAFTRSSSASSSAPAAALSWSCASRVS